MKVLVFTNMYPSALKPWWGTFVAEQVNDLRRAGVDVSVLDFDGTEHRLNYARAGLALPRFLRREPVDLVHAHYGLTGVLAVTQRRCPVVTTFHGGDFTGLVWWQTPISRLVAHLCTPIVVTEQGRRRLGIPDAAVIPAGVDTNLFRPGDRGAARSALGLDPDAKYALLLGARSDRNKRADLFDAAVALARKDVPNLQTLSLEGWTRADVVNVMNAVDVSVMASDSEGSPVAVRESLACLTPVVSVEVGSVPDVLAGLPACAVVPRDPQRLADAIGAALAAGRPAALRERAERSSGDVVAKKLIELYERVLARRRRR